MKGILLKYEDKVFLKILKDKEKTRTKRKLQTLSWEKYFVIASERRN